MAWTYLDNAASTPLLPQLREELPDLLQRAFVNPSAGHPPATALRREIRRQTALLPAICGADDARVIWTSGGTEANNLALKGIVSANGSGFGSSLISTVAEHPSVTQPLLHLARQGAELNLVRVDDGGKIDLQQLTELLDPATQLVALGLVQGETGVVQDLTAIRACMDARAPRAHLHVDAVQAVAKVPIPWTDARIDSLSMSAHKVHGPGGVGALLLRPGLEIQPLMYGGGQQDNVRSGSLDGVGILSCCRALQLLAEDETYISRVTDLNQQLRRGLGRLPVSPKILSPADASPFILNFSFPGYEGAVLMRLLGQAGVAVATGSACSAESGSPSEILTSMGISRKVAFGALRVSFGWQNQAADVAHLLQALKGALTKY